MCRLLGLVANRPTSTYFGFYAAPKNSLEKLSKVHCDGWGIAWHNGKWHLYKEIMPLYKSQVARELIINCVRGRIIIAHVRKASAGSNKIENTHPFIYNNWVFAHNGTIYNRDFIIKMLKCEHKEAIEGATDSEAFFHLVVQEIEECGDVVIGIREAVSKLIHNGIKFSSLNFLASEGTNLYALRYAEEKPDYFTLYYAHNPWIHESPQLVRQLMQSKLIKDHELVAVASEKMSNDSLWNPIPNKALLIVNSDLRVHIVPLD